MTPIIKKDDLQARLANNHRSDSRRLPSRQGHSLKALTKLCLLCTLVLMVAGCQPGGDSKSSSVNIGTTSSANHSQTPLTLHQAPMVLKDWGPKETMASEGFNLQAGKISAIWIGVTGVNNHPETTVLWAGKPLDQIVVAPTVVTAAVPDSYFKTPGSFLVEIREGGSSRTLSIGNFTVTHR
jgi:hypothetical protein